MRSVCICCVLVLLTTACSLRVPGLDDRVGDFEKSNFEAKQVARRIAFQMRVVRSRPIINAKTKDPGVEVTVQEKGRKYNFKVYKIASEANLKRIVATFDGIETVSAAKSKQVRKWRYMSRKDLLFDYMLMPRDMDDELEKRFKKAVTR